MKKREKAVNTVHTVAPKAVGGQKHVLTLKCGECTDFVRRTAGLVCHVCITRHWFFCRGLALQPFILCFAVGPNGFEKFCYSPVTPEANVRIDFTCTGLHHLSRAQAVRAEAKWKAIHTKPLSSPCSARQRQPELRGGRPGGSPPTAGLHTANCSHHRAPGREGKPKAFPERGVLLYCHMGI